MRSIIDLQKDAIFSHVLILNFSKISDNSINDKFLEYIKNKWGIKPLSCPEYLTVDYDYVKSYQGNS